MIVIRRDRAALAEHQARQAAQARARAMAEVLEALDAAGGLSAWPAAERESWPAKAEAARRWLEDRTPSPALEAEAAIRGEPVDDLARTVLAKCEANLMRAARIAGLRAWAEAEIAAARDAEAVREAACRIMDRIRDEMEAQA